MHATDIFWVKKCATMHSSKDAYPAILLSTFKCTVSKNGHTHKSSLVVFTAKMYSCVCLCVCVCVCVCVCEGECGVCVCDHSWRSRFAFH